MTVTAPTPASRPVMLVPARHGPLQLKGMSETHDDELVA